MERSTLTYTGTALPLGSTTYNLFDTTLTGVKGFLSLARGTRFEVTVQNDQAGSLKAYWSEDGGTNWNLYNTTAVAIPAAGASTTVDFDTTPYRDWKVDWLNGGSNQTTFRITMVLISGSRPPAV